MKVSHLLIIGSYLIVNLANTDSNSEEKSLSNYIQNKIIDSDSNDNTCDSNVDCIASTFCCSLQKCEIPTVCLQGTKLFNDYCDYNFECLSRCCSRS